MADDMLRAAMACADQGQWPRAATLYAQGLGARPSASELVQYGHLLKEAGALNLAVQAYQAAIACNRIDVDAHLHLGHLFKRLDRPRDALDVFTALKDLPGAPHITPEINGLKVALETARLWPLAAPHAEETPPQDLPADLLALDRALHDRLAVPGEQEHVRARWGGLFRRFRVRMVAVAHVTALKGVYTATSDHPRMRLEVMPPAALKTLENRWVRLKIRITPPQGAPDPVLLVQQGAGWSSYATVPLAPRANGWFEAIFRTRAPVLSLRFDPLHMACSFRLSRPRLRRLSRARVIALALRRGGGGTLARLKAAYGAGDTTTGDATTGGWGQGGSGVDQVLADILTPRVVQTPYQRWRARHEAHVSTPSACGPSTAASAFLGWVLSFDPQDTATALGATLAALKAQTRPDWRLCILAAPAQVDQARALVARHVGGDSRVRVLACSAQDGLGQRLMTGMRTLPVDLVGHLRAGDVVSADLVARFAALWGTYPQASAVYCDDDVLHDGEREAPRFKPDWNMYYHASFDYIGRSVMFPPAVIAQAGGWRDLYPGQQDYDLMLRVAAQATRGLSADQARARIVHLPAPLWHTTAPLPPTADPLAPVNAMLAMQGAGIVAQPGAVPGTLKLNWPLSDPPPHVTIIIPTRDRLDLVQRAVDSILTKTDYPAFDIVIVDNGSVQDATLAYFARIARDPRVSLLRDDGGFNFSRLNNRAAAQARGAVLALVNNDIEVIDPHWLTEMTAMAQDPGIGAVGAKLLYASGHVQHAGIIGGVGMVAAHGHKYEAGDAPGYMNRLVVQQQVVAVTAACLVVERRKYLAVGGMDEDNLTVAFNDVDLCLKLAAHGWSAVFTPWARLYHHESVSRGKDLAGARVARFHAEAAHMERLWGDTLLKDPFYSPNLTHAHEDFSY